MRQRMIKPEFFSSESMADCSIGARLCFIGLWCCADDEGRMVFAERSLKKDIFGLDDVSAEEFLGFLVELENVGSIKALTDGEEVYIVIPHFSVYQTINKPRKSTITDTSRMRHVLLRDASVNVHSKERKNELIKQSEKGVGSDAAPFLSDDWKKDYMEELDGVSE